RLSKTDHKLLSNVERKKFAQLALAYANKFENDRLIVSSSLTLLADAKSFADIQDSNLYPAMRESFKKLNDSQKIKLLEDFNDTDNLAVAMLAQIEADESYLNGDKSGAKDVVSWLSSEFGRNPEVREYIRDFNLRIETSSRISTSNIGVVLPLTGEKASYGQKVLAGVDTGLKLLGMSEELKVHTKDAGNSPAQAAQAVLDLIREEKVAFII